MHRFVRGKARSYTPGRMNGTESRYESEVLLARKATGDVVAWWFESVKYRLADNTFYTPDFLVQLASGELECHEIKGHWEDDARVKIKVAASLYPLRFIAVQYKKKQWVFEEISGR